MKANGALSLFLSLMLIFSLAPVVSAEEPQPVADAVFTDLAENAWYAADIAAAASRGLMTGGPGNTFIPEAPMTRAMAVTTLFRLANEPDAAQSPFSDVPADCWYEHAVNWAWENGITQGSSASCFSPDRVCTPQEAASFFYRYAALTGHDTAAPEEERDHPGVSAWAAEAVAWAADKGILDYISSPTEAVTRGLFAVMLNAFCEATMPSTEGMDSSAALPEDAEHDIVLEAPGEVAFAPYAASGTESLDGSGDAAPGAPVKGSAGGAVVSYAMQFIGNPYKWGGTSLVDGCDAAGFVYRVFQHFGFDQGRLTSDGFATVGEEVKFEDLQAGDVVVYSGSVAIYDGGGNIIMAESTRAGITSNKSVNYMPIISIRRLL